MTLKSIHTDDSGKYCCAVYACSTKDHAQITDEWISSLFPRKYGKSVTANGVVRANGRVSWYMMITNRRQTTPADIADRMERKLNPLGISDFHVEPFMSTIEISEATRTGTTRLGTKRARKNASHHVGIVAR